MDFCKHDLPTEYLNQAIDIIGYNQSNVADYGDYYTVTQAIEKGWIDGTSARYINKILRNLDILRKVGNSLLPNPNSIYYDFRFRSSFLLLCWK